MENAWDDPNRSTGYQKGLVFVYDGHCVLTVKRNGEILGISKDDRPKANGNVLFHLKAAAYSVKRILKKTIYHWRERAFELRRIKKNDYLINIWAPSRAERLILGKYTTPLLHVYSM